jgi:LPXTG-motif cell wall-anchored protein
MSNIHRKAALLAAFIGATLAVGAAMAAPSAGAQAAAPATPVTDYATYPAALPAGCPDGTSALIGVTFDNGRGAETTDLQTLDVRSGDTLTMTWSAFAPACRTEAGQPAIAVSMAAYEAGAATFDPSADQQLLPGWTTCGFGQTACSLTEGRYHLSLTIPPADVACTIQADAVIGLPLAVVGPHGSYYNSAVRGDERPNLLIADTHVVTAPCPVPATTSPPTPAPAATPVTTPPTTAVALPAATETAAPVPTTAVPTGVEAAQATRAVPLPNTGRDDSRPAVLAAALLLAGLGAVGAARVAERRRPATGPTI